ncbi:VOC family protein [Xanthomonas sp. Kuri4-1]
MAKVTGIGGVFFKSRGAGATLAAWYRQHLGLPLEAFGGAVLRWSDDHAGDGATAWQVVDHDSDGFGPGASPFMINYRVDDLDALLAQLQADGVAVLAGPETYENGRFAWLLDPEGNKLELWEPRAGA